MDSPVLKGTSDNANGLMDGFISQNTSDGATRKGGLSSTPKTHNGAQWMEDKLEGMELIMDEEIDLVQELDDLSTDCPKEDSSEVTSSSSDSFTSNFNESITTPITEAKEESLKTTEPPLDTGNGPETQTESVDFPGQSSEAQCVENTSGCGLQKASKLPTPSQHLKNCSTFTRSPVRCSQLEELKELRNLDISNTTTVLSHNNLQNDDKPDSQSSSGGSSPNDTFVVSRSSNTADVLSGSETSGQGSSVSAVSGSRGLKKPRTIQNITNRPAAKSKLVKPTSKPSLLPSKSSHGFIRPPQSREREARPAKNVTKPTTVIGKTSKLCLKDQKSQENRGVPTITNPVLKKRETQSGRRLRKSSIPKPIALCDLRKNQSTKVSSSDNKSTRVVQSSSATVIQSTPISTRVKDSTPSRRKSVATDTPTRAGESTQAARGIRPSLSLSSIESSEPEKSVPEQACKETPGSQHGSVTGALMKTPRTVTKRRSLLPTPGGKEWSAGVPRLNLDSSEKKPPGMSLGQVSGSVGDKQPMPPPKRQFKPRIKSSGLQKPKTAPGRGRVPFKPRNGPVARPKNDGPIKPMPSYLHGDNLEFGSMVGGSKVVHSPVNKQDMPGTPHSEWSPIRKKRDLTSDDACFQCTKRVLN